MANLRTALRIIALLTITVSCLCCRHLPRGDWRIETGRARVVDELGQNRPRIDAVAEAQEEARVKLLHFIEEMPASDNRLVGDYMTQQPRIGQRIRDLVVSARRIDTRYSGKVVEVDMGVNLDDVRRILLQARQY